MRAPVDVGFGLDPSVVFADMPVSPPVVQPPAPAAPLITNEKVAYLRMQEAILNQDAPTLATLVATHPLLLTEARKNTLGKMVVKHFTPALAKALEPMEWANIVTVEMMMGCVNADNAVGFDFCLQKIATDKARAPTDTFVFMLYNSLSAPNKKNYPLYNAYRAKVAPHLTQAERDEAAARFCRSVAYLTPSTCVCYSALVDEIKEADWKTVFTQALATDAFNLLTSPDRLFGLAWLFSAHPPIAHQFSQAQTQWDHDAMALKNFIRTAVLSPNGGDVFSSGFSNNAHRARRVQEAAAERLLSPFHVVLGLYKSRLDYTFNKSLEEAYSVAHPHSLVVPLVGITERVLTKDALACVKLPSNVVQRYLADPLGAERFAKQLMTLPVLSLKKIQKHVDLARPDELGHSVLHRMAHLAAACDVGRLKTVLGVFDTWEKWETQPNPTGQTAKDVLMANMATRPPHEQALLANLMLKNELKKTLGTKLKSKRATPSRKM